jgi:hypothetical protein
MMFQHLCVGNHVGKRLFGAQIGVYCVNFTDVEATTVNKMSLDRHLILMVLVGCRVDYRSTDVLEELWLTQVRIDIVKSRSGLGKVEFIGLACM